MNKSRIMGEDEVNQGRNTKTKNPSRYLTEETKPAVNLLKLTPTTAEQYNQQHRQTRHLYPAHSNCWLSASHWWYNLQFWHFRVPLEITAATALCIAFTLWTQTEAQALAQTHGQSETERAVISQQVSCLGAIRGLWVGQMGQKEMQKKPRGGEKSERLQRADAERFNLSCYIGTIISFRGQVHIQEVWQLFLKNKLTIILIIYAFQHLMVEITCYVWF